MTRLDLDLLQFMTEGSFKEVEDYFHQYTPEQINEARGQLVKNYLIRWSPAEGEFGGEWLITRKGEKVYELNTPN